ncbi:hypothetical protein DMB66_55025 [Actinoplanes sp. ATCC 53533]|uniref:DUF1775 domain-containing protein n=1 Tax=Actinoplanes sp. ATCC 53533 TaxID=1288362 RepID=UPI000F79FF86|nr:DUF1775 domain-containing protein [Actinoplanes sp. ATCC 53533]RSM42179.1 hypothetical protein DMB66_55025 [Actinoplanes sp. ATCC 53533]
MRLRIQRRVSVLALAAAAGSLFVGSPALADASVNPASAPQQSGVNLTFRVTNTSLSAPITKVKVSLPVDMAVAEVYPLSVPDWAPQITQKRLAKPITTMTMGTPVSEVTSAITWTAVPGKTIAPGKSADLRVALGPLPTTSTMSFLVEPTYAGGEAGPTIPPTVLRLTAPVPGQQPAAQGHGGATSGTDTASAAEQAQFARLVADATAAPSPWTFAGWILAALCAAAAGVMVLRSRRRPAAAAPATGGPAATTAPAGDPSTAATAATDTSEADGSTDLDGGDGSSRDPVTSSATKTKITAWAYRDGPRDES